MNSNRFYKTKLSALHKIVRDIVANQSEKPKYKVPIAQPSFTSDDYNSAIDTLLSRKFTMGKKVKTFESKFAKFVGIKNPGIMVNSGSSANLIALSVLKNANGARINPGDEIITPAVTWATTIFPISMIGAVPVLVDINRDSYNIDVKQIRKSLTKKTKAIMLVHLLGNPCNIDEIKEIAKENNLSIIEDCCEAHGAMIHGKKVGTFGDLATFSFFISHHISTMEGGMVLSKNGNYCEIAKSLRAFGWIREIRNKNSIAKLYPSIDPRFLFLMPGFNLRPTEIQGSFGLTQLPKLEQIIRMKIETAKYWNERLSKYEEIISLPVREKGTRHVYFAYAISVKTKAPFSRNKLVSFLESKGIETRPVMTGNIANHPALSKIRHKKIGKLPNAEFVNKNSFLIGNHVGITNESREYVADVLEKFIRANT